MVSPPVSVVICAYNAERFVEAAMQSVLGQTYRHLELLVIDDGSTDTTAQVASRVAAADPRCRVIRRHRNGGIAEARATGVNQAAHELVLFVDADDTVLPEMLDRQVQRICEDEKIMGVGTYAYYVNGDDGSIIGIQAIGPATKEAFFEAFERRRMIFMLVNTLFRRSLMLEVGGFRLEGFSSVQRDRSRDYCEDLDLWCRMSDLGARGYYFVTIPEPLLRNRKTSGSLSSSNVFAMQAKMRWIKDCLVRRRAGQRERSFEEFAKARSRLQKLADGKSDIAALLYKQMGFRYAARDYVRAALLFAGTCVLDPKFALQKLATQRRNIEKGAT